MRGAGALLFGPFSGHSGRGELRCQITLHHYSYFDPAGIHRSAKGRAEGEGKKGVIFFFFARRGGSQKQSFNSVTHKNVKLDKAPKSELSIYEESHRL